MFAVCATLKAKIYSKMWSLTNCELILQPLSVEVFGIKCSNLYYIRSTELNETKLVLRMVNFREQCLKVWQEVQNHLDSNTFCTVV